MYWIEITRVNKNDTLHLDDIKQEQLRNIVLALSETSVEMKWGTYNPVKLEGGCLGWVEEE